MSEIAKKARAAMKAKAKSLADRPVEKVDSSDWTPPPLLNADVKTGMRPVSRRAFKSGGKVSGEANKARADRKARKAGGSAEQPIVDRYINRDLKKANEYRDGEKHIGGMKSGGRAHKLSGGALENYKQKAMMDAKAAEGSMGSMGHDLMGKMYDAKQRHRLEKREKGIDLATEKLERMGKKSGGRAKKQSGGSNSDPMFGLSEEQKAMVKKGIDPYQDERRSTMVIKKTMDTVPAKDAKVPLPPRRPADLMKKGGRAGKADGGMMDPRLGIVKPKAMEFGQNVVTPGLKKGGKAEHPDVAQDKALIKKMIKPSAMKDSKCYGGRAKKQTGGGVFTGPGYPGKVPGVVPGGRDAHAKGGRAKGKTNINIVIAAGKQPQDQQSAMPAMPPRGPAMPPMPPMGAGAPAMAGGLPPGLAAGAPPMGGPAMPPMGRKLGGRITKIAKSYEDMEAGAGSGEGRLQKTDIAKRTMHKDGGKVGHRKYRSYKDMDAGAGSGLGRLEKTEIESHK